MVSMVPGDLSERQKVHVGNLVLEIRRSFPFYKGSAESSQRLVETRVLQRAFNVRDVPGVSASMIRMFMWPLRCLKGSSSELTLACSNLD